MKLERVEIVHVAIPLVTPFRTSVGTMATKDTFLLHVVTDTAEGWSEFAADREPLYCSEFVAGAEIVLRDFLLPRVAALPLLSTAHLAPAMEWIKGHEPAKAAMETAVLVRAGRRPSAGPAVAGHPRGTAAGGATALHRGTARRVCDLTRPVRDLSGAPLAAPTCTRPELAATLD